MNSCKTFSGKYPLLLAVLSVVFMFALLKLMKLVPDGPMNFAITEAIMAVAVFGVTFLFMGKEKISFSTKGLRYAFHSMRISFQEKLSLNVSRRRGQKRKGRKIVHMILAAGQRQ